MRQQKATTRPVVSAEHDRAGETRPTDVRDTPVSTIMSSPAIAVRADVSLDVALATFAINRVRHLAVVDEAGRCIGMVTDRMVTAQWALRPMTFAETLVSRVCEGPPVATPRATLAEVARVLGHHATDAVVVIDDVGRPLGVITTSDLVAAIARPRHG